jgi:hypothetical protein
VSDLVNRGRMTLADADSNGFTDRLKKFNAAFTALETMGP